MEHFLKDLNATHSLGFELAQPLLAAMETMNNEGPLVLLSGELGSGKTCLVQGLARGLNIFEPITSPTFTLCQWYSGQTYNNTIHLRHIDLYRLDYGKTADDFFAEEKEDSTTLNAILIIEWPERLSIPPRNCWNIHIEIEVEGRRVLISPPLR